MADELALTLHCWLATFRTLLVIAGWIVELAVDRAAMPAWSGGGNGRMESLFLAKRNAQILAFGVAVAGLHLSEGQSIGPIPRHHLTE